MKTRKLKGCHPLPLYAIPLSISTGSYRIIIDLAMIIGLSNRTSLYVKDKVTFEAFCKYLLDIITGTMGLDADRDFQPFQSWNGIHDSPRYSHMLQQAIKFCALSYAIVIFGLGPVLSIKAYGNMSTKEVASTAHQIQRLR